MPLEKRDQWIARSYGKIQIDRKDNPYIWTGRGDKSGRCSNKNNADVEVAVERRTAQDSMNVGFLLSLVLSCMKKIDLIYHFSVNNKIYIYESLYM